MNADKATVSEDRFKHICIICRHCRLHLGGVLKFLAVAKMCGYSLVRGEICGEPKRMNDREEKK